MMEVIPPLRGRRYPPVQEGKIGQAEHDRRPVFLYPQLDERGLEHQTDEPEPGVVRIVIRKKGGAG